MQGHVRRRAVAAISIAATVALTQAMLPAGSALADPEGPVLVASGLDNPRGLVFGDDGRLYVGEAGHAGPTCTGSEGENGPLCLGFTSRISSIVTGTGERRTVVDRLVSIGTAVAATGIDGVAFDDGYVAGIVTGSPQGVPADACDGSSAPDCAQVVAKAKTQFGDLKLVIGKTPKTLAEVGTFDYQYVVDHKATLDPDNPDFNPGDANPYGITTAPHDSWYVVDAGSNTLDLVDEDGKMTVLAYLPNPPGPPDQRFPYDAVPTCVAARGANVWIGTLSGEVYRWNGGGLKLVADRNDGTAAINGCGMDKAGNLYVANIFGVTPETFFAPHSGSVMKITPAGAVTTVAGSQGLSYPSGIAVSGHQLFVAVQSICPKNLSLVGPDDPPVCDKPGQVVRLAI